TGHIANLLRIPLCHLATLLKRLAHVNTNLLLRNRASTITIRLGSSICHRSTSRTSRATPHGSQLQVDNRQRVTHTQQRHAHPSPPSVPKILSRTLTRSDQPSFRSSDSFSRSRGITRKG